jgi:outer membrane autotransporter protein
VARGSQASSGVGGRLAAGVRLGWDDWQLEPTIGFSALGLWTPASLEREPNGLAQRIEGQSLTSLQGSLALPVARTFTLPEERPLRMRGVVGWLHEFADVTATTVAAFAQAPAAPFAATTAPIDRDALLLGLSADLAVGEGTTLFAGWQATLGSTTTVQAVRAGLRLTF